MKGDNQRLKRVGTFLLVAGLGIWLTAVVVASEASKLFLGTVYVGWAIALAGVLVHVLAFFKERE